jgi:hypothetical protein
LKMSLISSQAAARARMIKTSESAGEMRPICLDANKLAFTEKEV